MTTIHTEIGRLSHAHKGARVTILDVADAKISHSGVIEDIGHYLDNDVTSIRFEGEAQAHFRRSDFHVEIDLGRSVGDLVLIPAYEDARLALMVGGRESKAAGLLARQAIDSGAYSIFEALAQLVDDMAAAVRDTSGAEELENADPFTQGQFSALLEVSEWLRGDPTIPDDEEDESDDEDA